MRVRVSAADKRPTAVAAARAAARHHTRNPLQAQAMAVPAPKPWLKNHVTLHSVGVVGGACAMTAAAARHARGGSHRGRGSRGSGTPGGAGTPPPLRYDDVARASNACAALHRWCVTARSSSALRQSGSGALLARAAALKERQRTPGRTCAELAGRRAVSCCGAAQRPR